MDVYRSVGSRSENHGYLRDRNVKAWAGRVFDDAVIGRHDCHATNHLERGVRRADRHHFARMLEFGQPRFECDRASPGGVAPLGLSLNANQDPFKRCVDDLGLGFDHEVVLTNEYGQPGDGLGRSYERNQVPAMHRCPTYVAQLQASQIARVGFSLRDLGFSSKLGPNPLTKFARQLLQWVVRPLTHAFWRVEIRGFTTLQSTDSLIDGEWTAGRRLGQPARETEVSRNGREPW